MFFGRKAGLQYVHRGDPIAADFTQATLTADSAVHTLSLASIIPANAKLVHLRVVIKKASTEQRMYIFKVGLTGYNAVNQFYTQAVNVSIGNTCIVDCPSRQIAYWLETGAWAGVTVCVIGWFI
jgi:hypothetical protein